MLHVATSHLASPRWIDIQARALREHVQVPYTTWGSIPLIDPAYGDRFDRLIGQKGPEYARLNHLAAEICREAADEDLLMFLAPDAFPVADPMPTVRGALDGGAVLVAARRSENAGDPQPHPCFCVTSVGTWRRLGLDWSDSFPWTSSDGRRVTDVGANVMRRLELVGERWVPLPRTNPAERDPLMFAVYGDIVYHHGAGELSRAHRLGAPRPLPVPRLHLAGAAVQRLNTERTLMWERLAYRRMGRLSEQVTGWIEAGGDGWLQRLGAGKVPPGEGR